MENIRVIDKFKELYPYKKQTQEDRFAEITKWILKCLSQSVQKGDSTIKLDMEQLFKSQEEAQAWGRIRRNYCRNKRLVERPCETL